MLRVVEEILFMEKQCVQVKQYIFTKNRGAYIQVDCHVYVDNVAILQNRSLSSVLSYLCTKDEANGNLVLQNL